MIYFRQPWRRWLLLILLAFLMSASFVMSYTVVLKNGNRIEGTLLSEDRDTIRIRNKSGIEATFHKTSLDLVAMEKLNRNSKQTQPSDKPFTNKDLEDRYGAHDDSSESQGPLASAMDQVLDGLVAAVPTPSTPRDRISVIVDSTTDAQTLKVRYDIGLIQPVRLIGVRAAVNKNDCYGPESIRFLSDRLPTGSKAVIETDHSKDKSGQVLAYVYAADGRMVNLEMIRKGYGRVDEAAVFDRMPEFVAAQAKAMRDTTGIWRACLPIPTLPKEEESQPSDDAPLK
jgi:endonuclease YncB( thermonuclease family)